MKKFIMILIAAAFMLSVGECRAQSGSATPESKAEYFVERIFSALNENDMSKITLIGEEMGEYISSLNEQQSEEFGGHFAKKLYASSERYGYGKEFADAFLKSMVGAMLGEDGEKKEK